MPKLRVLSGKDVVKILSLSGFLIYSQKGSHVKMKRETNNETQILVIPNHGKLKKGMLKALFNQASKYITEEELRPHFYTN